MHYKPELNRDEMHKLITVLKCVIDDAPQASEVLELKQLLKKLERSPIINDVPEVWHD